MRETSVLIEGGLNLLLGKPGAGKSFLAAAMAADISRGLQPATGEPRCPGAAFYLAGEERAKTIVNRLNAAGADLGRVIVLAQSLSKSGLRQLPQLAKAGDVSLAVFDPLPQDAASQGELANWGNWRRPDLLSDWARTATRPRSVSAEFRRLTMVLARSSPAR